LDVAGGAPLSISGNIVEELMSISINQPSWSEKQTRKQAIRRWLSRRRIAISLLAFSCLVGFNVLVIQPIPLNPFAWREPWVRLADSAILLGLLIRTWSAGTLNKSRDVTMHGPYAVVRNPLYIGSFLLMFGFCLLTKDWLTLFLAVGPMSWVYWNQVRQEESRLATMFPKQWHSYAEAVPRFLPKRFSLQMLRGWRWQLWWLNREYQAALASLIAVVGIYGWYQAR
jgi:protein-S-isoprenylcysteine O-methyltransferase Ste14